MFIVSFAAFVLPLGVLAARNATNRRRCFNPELAVHHPYAKLHVMNPDDDIPDSVDWRDSDYVTDVKDQGSCGDCYIFAAIAALEGQWRNATGDLVVLSEQNVLDCDVNSPDHGCGAGMPNNVFDFIKNEGGVDTEDSYWYLGYQESDCFFNKTNVGATVSGYTNVGKSDDELLHAVATVGPIAVGIDDSGFNEYKGGISDGGGCSSDPSALNHAVTVVGYGVEDDQAYWIIKNSWGESFGEGGYIRLTRDTQNICGITNFASYPTVDVDN